jgi:hypothetical protein
MLAGLRSRCTTPWRWLNSSADRVGLPNCSHLAVNGKGPVSPRCSSSRIGYEVAPVARRSRPLASSRTIFGCESRASASCSSQTPLGASDLRCSSGASSAPPGRSRRRGRMPRLRMPSRRQSVRPRLPNTRRWSLAAFRQLVPRDRGYDSLTDNRIAAIPSRSPCAGVAAFLA